MKKKDREREKYRQTTDRPTEVAISKAAAATKTELNREAKRERKTQKSDGYTHRQYRGRYAANDICLASTAPHSTALHIHLRTDTHTYMHTKDKNYSIHVNT